MAGSGLVLVDKPAGCTSHDVVATLRRAFTTRKVGHAGTLDPMATGLLVVGINSATRTLGLLTLSTKTYLATIRLGASSSTDDKDGTLSPVTDSTDISDEEIHKACANFMGTILQRPSSVSAIKIAGQRAHALVRAGEEVSIESREINVSRLDIDEIRRDAPFIDVDVDIECSSGTYIRAIARDIGASFGVGGHLTSLRRMAVGPFSIHSAERLDTIAHAHNPEKFLIPLGHVASLCWDTITVDAQNQQKVALGQRLPSEFLPQEGIFGVLNSDKELLALAEVESGRMSYRAVLIGSK